MTIDLELFSPVNQSRKVSRADYNRTGLYAHMYHQLAAYVDSQGNEVCEMSAADMSRWMAAADLAPQDKVLAVFLKSLMFHLGAWAKMRVDQAVITKGWHLHGVQELFTYTPEGMDLPPATFHGGKIVKDSELLLAASRVTREDLKTFCLVGDSALVKTDVQFAPMNVHAAKLAVVILHMEVYYQSRLVVKRQTGEDYTAWFHRLTETMSGKAVRKPQTKSSFLPRKTLRR